MLRMQRTGQQPCADVSALRRASHRHHPMKNMKKLIIILAFATVGAFAQQPAPTLEQIKIAADAGDPAAQDKLAENFILRTDTAQAEMWYRKAAAQGYAHAQGQLGNMLLMRSRMAFALKPDARAAIADEAVKWMTLAANQGDKQGQANLADVCLEAVLQGTPRP
jgi:TPR repeat protein